MSMPHALAIEAYGTEGVGEAVRVARETLGIEEEGNPDLVMTLAVLKMHGRCASARTVRRFGGVHG